MAGPTAALDKKFLKNYKQTWAAPIVEAFSTKKPVTPYNSYALQFLASLLTTVDSLPNNTLTGEELNSLRALSEELLKTPAEDVGISITLTQEHTSSVQELLLRVIADTHTVRDFSIHNTALGQQLAFVVQLLSGVSNPLRRLDMVNVGLTGLLSMKLVEAIGLYGLLDRVSLARNPHIGSEALLQLATTAGRRGRPSHIDMRQCGIGDELAQQLLLAACGSTTTSVDNLDLRRNPIEHPRVLANVARQSCFGVTTLQLTPVDGEEPVAAYFDLTLGRKLSDPPLIPRTPRTPRGAFRPVPVMTLFQRDLGFQLSRVGARNAMIRNAIDDMLSDAVASGAGEDAVFEIDLTKLTSHTLTPLSGHVVSARPHSSRPINVVASTPKVSGSGRSAKQKKQVPEPEPNPDVIIKRHGICCSADTIVVTDIVPTETVSVHGFTGDPMHAIPPSVQVALRGYCTVQVGFSETIGRRPTYEDAHIIMPCFRNNPGEHLFAILDGHGGRETADRAAAMLPVVIAKTLSQYPALGALTDELNGTESSENGQPSYVSSSTILTLLKNAFAEVDRNIASMNLEDGCTCTLIYIIGRRIFCINVGDSRTVLLRHGHHLPDRLSTDHKPYDPDEVRRIEALGGFVENGRILGSLAVSRSFGDIFLRPYVCADPSTCVITMEPEQCIAAECSIVMLACDGVFDVMSDQSVVQVVQQAFMSGGTCNDAAMRVRNQAFNLGSTDNITAMVVRFTSIKKLG